MAKTGYVKTALTGGATSALDGVAGSILLDQDFAFVGVGNTAYFYILDVDSGAVESSPDVIAPDIAPGNKRWILQNYLPSGWSGVSTTSLTIATGSKTLTVQINKGFVVGMSVKIAYTTSPTNWMHGDITSYTPASGELIVNVTTILGSGTQSAWTVSLSAPILSTVPTGTILAFGAETAPGGYLECNGASVLRADYSDLFGVIGTAWGTADGTHFNIPDLRGKFPRGWDHAATNDPDRAARTAQAAGGQTGDKVGTIQGYAAGVSGSICYHPDNGTLIINWYQNITETRPINANVMYVIKY
jgi:hypothetical protein